MNQGSIQEEEQQPYLNLDCVSTGICVLKKGFIVVFWNQVLESWTSVPRQDIVGQNLIEHYEKFDREIVKSRIEPIFSGAPPAIFSSLLHHYLIPCLLNDGTFREQQTTVTPIQVGEKAFHAFVNIQDVTEQTRRTNDLRKMRDEALKNSRQLEVLNEKLENKNQELQNFTRVASHDLKAPLRSIINLGQWLVEDHGENLNQEGKEHIFKIQSMATRMNSLIKSLLNYAQANEVKLSFEMVDLGLLTEEVISDLSGSIQDTKGQVIVENLPCIEANVTQMRQLFQNLIGNALKYFRPNVPPVVKVTSQIVEDKKTCQIVIKDNGIGFEQEDAGKIFQPFKRLVHGEYDGSGIGLATVQKIIDKHHGSIEAQSTLGEGSKFTINLPVKQLP